ncbi:PREDICTED: lymphocyte antigen 6F [Chinchilla lanigera]|uniref:Lymphocyte antigen 6 family member L n=1 Tax=Chinchilla lanigera TaxID=34839 RepID=A0A8C2VJG3_CHILA|nr:PREDICTED: lymphocyte antigen 6F [Chinchilla lanigera]
MEGLMLVLVLWVSLVSMEIRRGKMTMPASNLSCYQCFKVSSISQCLPAVCRTTDQVCVSHEVIIYTSSRMKAQISKRCAPRCPNSNSWYEWTPKPGLQARIVRDCCSKNLCNKAPTRQEGLWVRREEVLPLVGLSFLWTLL